MGAPGANALGAPPVFGSVRRNAAYWDVVVVVVVLSVVVVTGWLGAGHLPFASGATSPCLSLDLAAFFETVNLTQRPDLPALWQSVTFLSACLALPLPLSPFV